MRFYQNTAESPRQCPFKDKLNLYVLRVTRVRLLISAPFWSKVPILYIILKLIKWRKMENKNLLDKTKTVPITKCRLTEVCKSDYPTFTRKTKRSTEYAAVTRY